MSLRRILIMPLHQDATPMMTKKARAWNWFYQRDKQRQYGKRCAYAHRNVFFV